jgi:dolichol-phosphate mannosyltransferase
MVAANRSACVLLCTFNEAANIGSLVAELMRMLPSGMILVVDDSSPDGTAQRVRELYGQDPRVHLRVREERTGLGAALTEGMILALDTCSEAVVTMDADWSHDPADVPRLLEALMSADLVIGSRYIRGGRIVGWPAYRRLLSNAANRYARTVLGLDQRDCSSGFRAYRSDALRLVLERTCGGAGYAIEETLLFEAKVLGVNICEIPISFSERRFGRSKMSVREIWDGARILWRLAAAQRAAAVEINHPDDATQRGQTGPLV